MARPVDEPVPVFEGGVPDPVLHVWVDHHEALEDHPSSLQLLVPTNNDVNNIINIQSSKTCLTHYNQRLLHYYMDRYEFSGGGSQKADFSRAICDQTIGHTGDY